MRVGAIIQARMDSSRLPGKVLMQLPFMEGETILGHIVNRLKQSKKIERIIIATSNNENDLPIVKEAKRLGVLSYRGSKDDVLKRFIEASEEFDVDVLIRITGDNPIVLVDTMDDVIAEHIECKADYTRNNNLPYGTSFEIVNTNILKQIHEHIPKDAPDREHVTSYIKKNKEKYRIKEIDHTVSNEISDVRLTVDYPSDYAVLNLLVRYLTSLISSYKLKDLEFFFEKNKWIREINNNNYQKKQLNSFEEEKEIAIELLGKVGLVNIVEKLRE